MRMSFVWRDTLRRMRLQYPDVAVYFRSHKLGKCCLLGMAQLEGTVLPCYVKAPGAPLAPSRELAWIKGFSMFPGHSRIAVLWQSEVGAFRALQVAVFFQKRNRYDDDTRDCPG
jgi:hypothetical protein